jgi:nitroreductase
MNNEEGLIVGGYPKRLFPTISFRAAEICESKLELLNGGNKMLTNQTLATIKSRRSVRSYKPEQIGEDALRAIIYAGIQAPYAEADSKYFTAVQNGEMLNRISREAKAAAVRIQMPGLAELGRNEEFHCLYHAPTVVIISGRETAVALESDCAAAAQNILLAAESLDIGSCWLFFPMTAFFVPEGVALRNDLQIPDGFKPVIAVALGYKREKNQPAPERDYNPVCYLR